MQKRHTLVLAGHSLDVTGLSARNRRLLVLGVRGGDGDDPNELDVLLERVTAEALTELADADVAALRAELDTAAETVRARLAALPEAAADWTDADLAAAREIEAELARIDTALEVVSADDTRREEAAATRATEAQALLDSIRGDAGDDPDPEAEPEVDPTADPEADPVADPEADPEADPVTEGETALPIAASAPPRRVEARRSATAPTPRRSAPAVDERMVLRASANAGGFGAGELLDTPDKIARAFLGPIRASVGYRGPAIPIPIMSLGVWDAEEVYGADRTLTESARDNAHKIEKWMGQAGLSTDGHVIDEAKLAASQGACAPPPIRYDQPVIGTDARPVRDSAFAMFGADRSGIRTLPPPHLADVTGAITVWTEENDRQLDDPSTKACLTLTCPEEEESLLDAIVQCLKVGNYRARNFPEQITAWMSKVAQQAAKVAETKMLTEIGADSTQVNVPTVLGTTRDILTTLDRATAQIRNRHRLDPNYPFRWAAPAWLRNNAITDLAREQPGATAERLATSEEEIARFIASRGVNVTWFLDGESGQVYGDQADGDLLGWKSHVISYLYPEGQWIGGDGGSLDFGLVRDSILNATNDFMLMSEFFEFTHQIHLADSYRLDNDICPDGTTSAAKAITVCAGGS